MAKKGKSHSLSVRLLKEDKTINDIVDDSFGDLIIDETMGEDSIKGYLLDEPPNQAWWKNYLKIDRDVFNKTNSFILFITADKRIFAYTFGFAHNNLKLDDIVENFGFMATINSLDGEKLKSIETHNPSNNTKQTKIVSSILTNIYEYYFNDQMDMVQRLSGKVKDEFSDLFKNPTGIDGLKISTKKSKDELIELSKTLLERYLSEDYLKDDNLKNINKIKKASSAISKELDEMLIKSMKNNADGIFLTDFEMIECDELYKYKFKGNVFDDFELEEIKQQITLDSIKALREERVHILKSEDEKDYKSWSLYKCLSADFKLEDKHYYLARGFWYQIDDDFLAEIDNIQKHLLSEHDFPKYKKGNEYEYNKYVVNSNSTKYHLFDRENVNIKGRSKIEICDIYDKENNIFYHIKRGNGTSALSQLWNQGLISEQIANSGVPKYIDKFKEVCGNDLKEGRKVYYGIISKPNLPIFSQLSLYNILNSFKQMGIKENSVRYFFIEESCE
ncbi:MAG: TIGR04141 family sporadically distributed protein [Rickettsiales bacterium]|jgi:uncharacterized protein (TIGR04141 family)|nr:TIGR04141 family sporadically distributed protein [Rickettsiales bacterium]